MANVIVKWNANDPAEQISKYRVYQDGQQKGEPSASPFTVADVAPGVHEYQVSAVGPWGESSKSDPVKTPPAASVPGGVSIEINVSVTL